MTRILLALMAFALGYHQGVRRERAYWTQKAVGTAEQVVKEGR